jgi:hypothetical protein
MEQREGEKDSPEAGSGRGRFPQHPEKSPAGSNGDWPTGWFRLNRSSRVLAKAPGPPVLVQAFQM